MRFRVECRASPDYDKKRHLKPSWMVLVFQDNRLVRGFRFDGENPQVKAEECAKAVRALLRRQNQEAKSA